MKANGGSLKGVCFQQDLNLAKNHIGAEGAKHLARGLKLNNSLTRLDLQWCKLRADGMVHMFTMLLENTILTELNLSRNGIGDKGVQAIVPTLRKNRGLKVTY